MSLVTNGLGGSSSSSVITFNIIIKKDNFNIKKQYIKFDTKIQTVNFKIKEVEK